MGETQARIGFLVKSHSVETGMQPRELPVVAGQLALDFANTVDDPGGPEHHDHIATYAGLLAWSVRLGPLTADQAAALGATSPRAAAAAVRKAHTLRTAIQDVFGPLADGADPDGPGWAVLRGYVAEAVSRAELDGVGYRWAAEAPHAMLWPVAQAAADLLRGPDLARVKRCGGCPWLFVDRSRNGSRRWCAMGDCGTHAKIVKYVDRRRARREATGG
jgi:predicted RNA-binding Zn ribbon-like protein